MKKLFLLLLFLSSVSLLISQQSFQNVASLMGISGQSGLGHAVGWGDIDNDGDPDLGFSNQDGSGFWFYRNDIDSFTNITNSAGLSGLSANKIIICELNGDEFNDLLIRTLSGTQKLFKSNGDGTFTDISTSSGVSAAAVYNIADFNNDGYTDLLSVTSNNYSILYNDGLANFSSSEIIAPLPDFMGVAILDYNNDGLMDIYGTTYGNSPNQLLRNNGDGSFSDETVEAGLEYDTRGHGLDVGDFNNDGFVDVYVGSYSSSRGELCKLFKNNGDGTFSDATATTNTFGHDDTRTTTFADYNNDGWLDIFSSHHDFYSYSNTMQKSMFGVLFEEVAQELGISGEWIGDYFGLGWADYNLDGAIDFFAAGHIDKYRLFENQDCPGTSISVKLKGIISNPNGIGARVEVKTTAGKINRFMLPDGGKHDFSELKLVIGLDGAYSTDSLTIYWPSGIKQELGSINAGENLVIIEDTLTTNILESNTHHNPTKIWPLPANNKLNVEFYLLNGGEINISLISLNTLTEISFIKETLKEGLFTRILNTNELLPGIYILKITKNNHSEFHKILII